MNLAAVAVDGQRVWVPRRGETVPPVEGAPAAGPPTSPASAASPGSGPEGAAGGLVDVNTASAEALEALPGIGPATAAAILAYREEHGPFAAVDDLLDVHGIGEAKLEALRDLVTV
jgi:competence protein ComEA